MPVIYKCDKCGKIIDKKLRVSVTDSGLALFKDSFYSEFLFCPKCAAPVAKYLKKFLTPQKSKK